MSFKRQTIRRQSIFSCGNSAIRQDFAVFLTINRSFNDVPIVEWRNHSQAKMSHLLEVMARDKPSYKRNKRINWCEDNANE